MNITYRCNCGSLVEFDQEDGDCEDDEVECPGCGESTATVDAIRRSKSLDKGGGGR